ncbi:hypothetical protein KACC15558_23900 [Brevibacterium ammoniilyticum]|uniref:Glycosyltransferase 2-like domain-containing protein n=1 Tax=Brevibacterium ammoniilyticum TaxID=1046555 RepID=A0ABP9U150_9MICO
MRNDRTEQIHGYTPDDIARLTEEFAVTVIVPAYNCADTLPRTLESLLAQSSDDFAVLVVDDGSDEDLLELLPSDRRFLGYRMPENRGYAAVTNQALDMIRSPWTIFVDGDDTLAPDCLEVLQTRGQAEGSDVVVLPLTIIEPSGKTSIGPFATVKSPLPAKDALDLFVAGRLIFNQHLLFRPNHVRAKKNTYSDLSFTVNLLSSAEQVSFENRPLYNYFLHEGSVTAQLRPTVWDMFSVLDDVEDALSQIYSPSEASAALNRMRWMQMSYMVSKAAGDTRSPMLRSEVYAWCRSKVRLSHVVDAMRARQAGKGLSLALARLSPSLHGHAYQLRTRLKSSSRE